RLHRDRLHHRAERPRRELGLAEAEGLALRLLAGGHAQDEVVDPPAGSRHRLLAVRDAAAVDVHVVGHAPVEGGVRGDLDRARTPPSTEHRPGVKQTRLAPPAPWPVAETGSKPGVSMNTKPLARTASA